MDRSMMRHCDDPALIGADWGVARLTRGAALDGLARRGLNVTDLGFVLRAHVKSMERGTQSHLTVTSTTLLRLL